MIKIYARGMAGFLSAFLIIFSLAQNNRASAGTPEEQGKELAWKYYGEVSANRFNFEKLNSIAIQLPDLKTKYQCEAEALALEARLRLAFGYRSGGTFSASSYDPSALRAATELTEKSLALGPQKSLPNYQMARIQLIKGQYAQATIFLEKHSAVDGKNFRHYYFSGEIAVKKEDTASAKNFFREAVSKANNPAEVALAENGRLNIAELESDDKTVEEIYLNMIKVDPKDIWNYGNYGAYLSNHGQHEKAMEYFKKGRELGSYPVLMQNMAVTYTEMGHKRAKAKDFAGAVSFYEQALASVPDWPDAVFSMTGAHINLSHWQTALQFAEKSLKMNVHPEQAQKQILYIKEKMGLIPGFGAAAPVTFEVRTVEEAYKSIPHRQTTYSASQSTLPPELSSFFERLFSLLDQGVIDRIRVSNLLLSGRTEKSQLASLADQVKSLQAPQSVLEIRDQIEQAMREQSDFLELWRDASEKGTPFNFFPRGKEIHPKVRSGSQKLRAAYSIINSRFPMESQRNKDAFFDHLCALDFI